MTGAAPPTEHPAPTITAQASASPALQGRAAWGARGRGFMAIPRDLIAGDPR